MSEEQKMQCNQQLTMVWTQLRMYLVRDKYGALEMA